jgi:Flp pilus assembly protein TadG
MTRRSKNSRPKNKGSILIVTCLSMVVVAGVAGLAIDVGRMCIARNELRSFADSAALSAALQLDGTSEGIARAQAAVTNAAAGPNAFKWDMATKAISNTTVQFAKGAGRAPNTPDAATWSANPPDPASYRFARVVASVDVPLTLMRAFLSNSNGNAPDSSTVAVSGTAGQLPIANLPTELLPLFSAIALEPGSPEFGFSTSSTPGKPILYTLRSPPGGDRKTEGDALHARVLEDSDPISPDYATYMANSKGNGRRIVGLPIQGAIDGSTTVGTGAFFLQPAGAYRAVTNSAPIRAEYIGPWTQGGSGYVVRLVE